MTSPETADAPFRKALDRLPGALEKAFEELIAHGPLETDGTEVTRAIFRRLAAFYTAQWTIRDFLSKRYMASAADFFVETIAFYLKALATSHQLDLEVASERQVRRKRGAMRPDISVWRDDHCLVCVECKTQLGWNRHGWESQFLDRERRLVADFTGASSFLVVMTADNWGGFGDNPSVGEKYFLLSKVWPTSIDFTKLDDFVITPVEGLLARVKALGTEPAT